MPTKTRRARRYPLYLTKDVTAQVSTKNITRAKAQIQAFRDVRKKFPGWTINDFYTAEGLTYLVFHVTLIRKNK